MFESHSSTLTLCSSYQSPGKYKAVADCRKRDSEDFLVRNGDVIQLLHEDGEGQW